MSSIVNVASEGDLVIAVGKDENQKLARVSSAIIKIASPVFQAMLGPSFMEGQITHDASNPLTLPDDDPTAAVNLFHILHYDGDQTSTTATDWLQKLIVLCDKYCCAHRIKDYLHYRLSNMKLTESDNFVIFGVIAKSCAFEIYAERMIRMTRKEAESSCHRDLRPLMPEGTFDRIQQYKTKTFTQYRLAVQDLAAAMYTSPCIVGYDICHGLRMRLTTINKFLYEHGVLTKSPDDDVVLPDMQRVMLLQFCDLAGFEEDSLDHNLNLWKCRKTCEGCQLDTTANIRQTMNSLEWGTAKHCRVCFECYQKRKFTFVYECEVHKDDAVTSD